MKRAKNMIESVQSLQKREFTTSTTGIPINKYTTLNEEEKQVLEKLRWDPEYDPNRGKVEEGSKAYNALVSERAKTLKQLDKY